MVISKALIRKSKVFILYIIFIIFAEVVTSLYDPSFGMVLHSVILVSLLVLSTFRYKEHSVSNLFLSLSLAPLIRIISLSLPLTYFPRSAWYLVSSVPILVAALVLMRLQGLGLRDVGITFRKPLAQVGIMLMGVPFGVVEYFILRPEPLATGLSLEGFVVLAAALVFSTGFVEEFVFRGIMQYHAVHALGGTGILGISVVFAALHIGWLSLLDIIFVFSIGLLFSYISFKTGNILGASLSHGITNVVFFLAMPFII